MTRILFVCLGNICRSPLAEAALRREAARVGLSLEVDSAGVGDWHVGRPPDPRACAVAARHGCDISGYRARQVTAEDFCLYDWIVALDRENLHALERLRPEGSKAVLSLLLDHVPGRKGEAVADPYHGEASDFELSWRDACEGARGLASALLARP